jgi:ABC-2 type transport system ATP-binding protein
VTVILVTHFMEEAEYLCDRVALLHHGHVIAIDTPAALGAGIGQRVSFRPSAPLDPALLEALPEVRSVTADGELLRVDGGGDLVAAVMGLLVRERVIPEQTRVEQSTLDDAFVALTADADAADAAVAAGSSNDGGSL